MPSASESPSTNGHSYVKKKKFLKKKKKNTNKHESHKQSNKKDKDAAKTAPAFTLNSKPLKNTRQGDYQVMNDIGKGGFGTVYRGLNVISGATVAIKSVSLAGVGQEDLEAIEMEILLMKNLEHENICKYVDSIRTGDYLLIILEFVENGAISSLVEKFDNHLPESLCKVYTAQLLQGLHYLHSQGVIHRDIKGANILTTKEGIVKLADFGVAAKLGDKTSGAEDVVGTPYWMAPEIIEMKSQHSVACDIWSVGCTVIELMTGKPPYFDLPQMPAMFRIVQDDHPPLPDSASSALEDFLMQCFQKDPTRRIDAQGLMKHPWLKDVVKAREGDAKLPEQLLEQAQQQVQPEHEEKKTVAPAVQATNAEGSEDDLDWDAEIEAEENVPFKQAAPTNSGRATNSTMWGDDGDDEDDPFAGMSDSEDDKPQPQRVGTPVKAKFQALTSKATTRAQQLNKFVEDDSADDFGDLEGDFFATSFERTQSNGVEEGEEEDDPFQDLDFDQNENKEVSKTAIRVRKAVSRAIELFTSHPNDEEVIVPACAELTVVLNSCSDVKTTDTRHIVIPIMDMLEVTNARVLLAVLKVVNRMVSYHGRHFQQSMSVVGLVPAIIKCASAAYPRAVRAEAANFIRLFCTGSDFARKMFVACGGLGALVSFLRADFTTDPGLVLIAVECVQRVFDIETNPKNDFCRLFCKLGLLAPLTKQLLALNASSHGDGSAVQLHVAELLYLFSHQGDVVVKTNFAHPAVLEPVLSVLPDASDQVQLLLLKAIRNIAMESRTRSSLQRSGVIPALIPFLNEQQPVANLSQVLATMYDMCRLSSSRQDACARAGIIPHLKRIVHSDLPIKQFAFTTIFLLSKTQRSQVELVKHGGVQIFVDLLSNQFWSIQALNVIADWLVEDPVRVGFLLTSTRNIKAVLTVFCETRGHHQFIEVLGSFYRMMSVSPHVLRVLGHNQTFVEEILSRLSLHESVSKLKIDLLKSLNLIVPSRTDITAFVAQFKLIDVLSKIADDQSVKMAVPLAKKLLKYCQQ